MVPGTKVKVIPNIEVYSVDDNRVSIGKVAGVYGIKGWVKVFPLTDFPERFKILKDVCCNRNGTVQMLAVEAFRPHQQGYLLKFRGINNPEQAKLLHNALLQIDEADVYPLPAGVYYHFQLLGLQVYDHKLGYLGVLSEILETGANDVYVVESPRFREILIPALKEVIQKVDLDSGRMEVALLPGLVEDTDDSGPDHSLD